MADEQTPAPGSPLSRSTSISSRTSNVSDQGRSTRYGQPPSRLPLGTRQTSVSMFTGFSTGHSQRSTSPGPSSTFDNQTSALSPGSIDRVFPVRSAVSIDPTATPAPRTETSDGFPGMSLGGANTIAARRQSTQGQERRERQSCSPSSRQPVTPPKRSSFDVAPGGVRLSQEAHDNTFDRLRSSTADTTASSSQRLGTQQMSNIISDSASINSENAPSTDGGVSLSTRPGSVYNTGETPLITARFKHIVTDGGHAVITGRDGETLQRCEDEPIHVPGAIQSFGLLLAFKEELGKLVVRAVSENSSAIIGYTPSQLFKLDNLLDIFSEEQADNLIDHLDFIRDDEAADVVNNGPEVFMISIRPPHQRTKKLWCAMHVNDADRELVICEFEVEDDTVNPLVPVGEATPEPPEDTLSSNPTPEELEESTSNISKPLRVLRSARKKRGEAAAMEVFNIMSQVQEQLANAATLPIFLRVLIGVIKELTGFHRVMIYQFDQNFNGRVVAELVDPRATKDLYKGLNFPASDIPRQAREMYKLNKVRLLYDRDQETSRLVCRTIEDLEKPLDMTHAYLRAISPIHIKYLTNMAVRASMSVSINAFGELWGLIACHSYGSKGMRVSFPIRKMCRLVGDTASRNIERLSYASRLQARKLINTSATAANPSGYIVASSDDLLKLFDSDAGALSIRDETKIMGKSQSHLQEILAMVEFLRLRRITSVYSSSDINADFPDLRYAPGLKFLAGLLYVPLSHSGNDFIVFFRQGVLQEVKWAGNPYEKFVKEGTEGYLEPRKSFKMWSEKIVGRCRDWTEEEVETASVLCLVYGKFIDVWRQKEAALQNSQLTKLLLANSAHEVRTPLNAIINYLEIALEGTLDPDTRESLAKSHSASKSLVYVINDLLDLTKTEGGRDLVKEEVFDLRATLEEATDPFIGDAKRKSLEYHITIEDVPHVVGDHRRVRQVVTNLIANAIQHTNAGSVSLHASLAEEQPAAERVEVEIAVEDTGAGMSQTTVDALFRELEEVSFEHEDSATKLLKHDPFAERGENHDSLAALGLGLAVVARTIRNMNGQLRLKTEEGKGSRFVIQLGFDLDSTDSSASKTVTEASPIQDSSMHPTVSSSLMSESGTATPNASEPGEFMLVNRSAQKRPTSSMVRKDSMESIASFKSGKSQGSFQSGTSQKSDVDRLIDAIQEPIRPSEEKSPSRRNSHEKKPKRFEFKRQEESPSNQKARSIGSVRDLKSAFSKVPGQEKVVDSNTPIKAVKLPETLLGSPSSGHRTGARVLFQEPGTIQEMSDRRNQPNLSADNFSILVAEDDPINSRIIQKRLEKLGHTVHLTVNGEECSGAHGEKASSYDAILMDLQMPIVDGFSSTKMIRSCEKIQRQTALSDRAGLNGRIPIFAVSASLVERDREKYIETGFDGWILKPVDFKRTNLFLKGIVDEDTRNECLYQPGKWEQGGWFSRKETQQEVNTTPSGRRPTFATDDGGDSGSDTTQRPLKADTL